MNKLIARLYDQATVLEGNGDYVCGELDPVKFAELIVRECIKCCIVAEVNYAINGEIEEADGAIGAKELIVGYFGVE